jgi:hypothetical protein
MLKRYHTQIYFPAVFFEEVETFLKQKRPFRPSKHALEKISHYSNLKRGQILEIVGGGLILGVSKSTNASRCTEA